MSLNAQVYNPISKMAVSDERLDELIENCHVSLLRFPKAVEFVVDPVLVVSQVSDQWLYKPKPEFGESWKDDGAHIYYFSRENFDIYRKAMVKEFIERSYGLITGYGDAVEQYMLMWVRFAQILDSSSLLAALRKYELTPPERREVVGRLYMATLRSDEDRAVFKRALGLDLSDFRDRLQLENLIKDRLAPCSNKLWSEKLQKELDDKQEVA